MSGNKRREPARVPLDQSDHLQRLVSLEIGRGTARPEIQDKEFKIACALESINLLIGERNGSVLCRYVTRNAKAKLTTHAANLSRVNSELQKFCFINGMGCLLPKSLLVKTLLLTDHDGTKILGKLYPQKNFMLNILHINSLNWVSIFESALKSNAFLQAERVSMREYIAELKPTHNNQPSTLTVFNVAPASNQTKMAYAAPQPAIDEITERDSVRNASLPATQGTNLPPPHEPGFSIKATHSAAPEPVTMQPTPYPVSDTQDISEDEQRRIKLTEVLLKLLKEGTVKITRFDAVSADKIIGLARGDVERLQLLKQHIKAICNLRKAVGCDGAVTIIKMNMALEVGKTEQGFIDLDEDIQAIVKRKGKNTGHIDMVIQYNKQFVQKHMSTVHTKRLYSETVTKGDMGQVGAKRVAPNNPADSDIPITNKWGLEKSRGFDALLTAAKIIDLQAAKSPSSSAPTSPSSSS